MQGCPLFDVVHPAFPVPTMAQFHNLIIPSGKFWSLYLGKATAIRTAVLPTCISVCNFSLFNVYDTFYGAVETIF